jgi:hypothetical protein
VPEAEWDENEAVQNAIAEQAAFEADAAEELGVEKTRVTKKGVVAVGAAGAALILTGVGLYAASKHGVSLPGGHGGKKGGKSGVSDNIPTGGKGKGGKSGAGTTPSGTGSKGSNTGNGTGSKGSNGSTGNGSKGNTAGTGSKGSGTDKPTGNGSKGNNADPWKGVSTKNQKSFSDGIKAIEKAHPNLKPGTKAYDEFVGKTLKLATEKDKYIKAHGKGSGKAFDAQFRHYIETVERAKTA